MKRQEWVTACLVAVGVAGMTVALTSMPYAWAEQKEPVTTPLLPPTELTIPAVDAEVTSTATPEPGKDVKLDVTVTSAAEGVKEVPVTVSLLQSDLKNLNIVSLSMPQSQRIAQFDTKILLDADGKGATTVQLPVQWSLLKNSKFPTINTGSKDDGVQAATAYQVVLSSPLGGKAVTSDLMTVPSEDAANAEVKPAAQ
jgi:hypothetical protein